MITIFAKIQKIALDVGFVARVRALFFCVIGRIIRIRIDSIRATTPPNLLGIERRIAYANKKYHSGIICRGVTRGLASL
jgi:hypothetical protein